MDFMYGVFLWIPPISFQYPELNAAEVRILALILYTSVAFISGYIMNFGKSKETHCIY